eukprot:290982_1
MTLLRVILALVFMGMSNGFTISVMPSREKCFHQVATEGQKLFGSYAVQFGGKLDIKISITDPESVIVYEEPSKRDGSFEFIAQQNGIYQLCIINKGVSVSTKRISFQFHIADKIKQAGLHVSKHFGSLESAISKIGIGIYSIQDHHHYMIIRDARARQTNESTQSRVSWMCFMELFVLLCLCAFQIGYIQHMFKRRR